MDGKRGQDPAGSIDTEGRHRRIVGSTAFWRGTTVTVALLTALVLWLDSLGGVFLPWMPPIMYVALVITFAVSLATFLRFRRMDRSGKE
ncbi:MAG: hypothetical protein V3S10_03065 [Dehalococcoidales bacterium]